MSIDIDEIHIRHCILFEFQSGNKAAVAAKNICDVYGTNAVTVKKIHRWFQKFRSGDFQLEDLPRSGRPPIVNEDKIREEIKNNPQLSAKQLAEKIGMSKSTAAKYVKLTRLQETGGNIDENGDIKK